MLCKCNGLSFHLKDIVLLVLMHNRAGSPLYSGADRFLCGERAKGNCRLVCLLLYPDGLWAGKDGEFLH